MRTNSPQRFEQDRDLLHHLTTLTPPTLLMNNGKSHVAALVIMLHCLCTHLDTPLVVFCGNPGQDSA